MGRNTRELRGKGPPPRNRDPESHRGRVGRKGRSGFNPCRCPEDKYGIMHGRISESLEKGKCESQNHSYVHIAFKLPEAED